MGAPLHGPHEVVLARLWSPLPPSSLRGRGAAAHCGPAPTGRPGRPGLPALGLRRRRHPHHPGPVPRRLQRLWRAGSALLLVSLCTVPHLALPSPMWGGGQLRFATPTCIAATQFYPKLIRITILVELVVLGFDITFEVQTKQTCAIFGFDFFPFK